MLFARFRCPKCDTVFKAFGLLAKSDDTKKCPKCGYDFAPIDDEDKAMLLKQEKDSCEHG